MTISAKTEHYWYHEKQVFMAEQQCVCVQQAAFLIFWLFFNSLTQAGMAPHELFIITVHVSVRMLF